MDFAKSFIFLVLSALLILSVGANGIVAEKKHLTNEAFGNTSPCKCVVFRMDDVRDDYLDAEQLKIMDLFITKGAPLTLAMVMHKFGDDAIILDKISEGHKKGLFELALHGWDHKNYSNLSAQDQKSSLYNANEKMQMIFGQKSDIFIPPYNRFNNDTLTAIKELGIKIMSSSKVAQNKYGLGKSIFISKEKKQNSTTPQDIYYLPYTTDFKVFNNHSLIKLPNEQIAKNINASIQKSGFAIVLIHPQYFIKLDEQGHLISKDPNKAQMNQQDINDLENLIDLLKQRGIVITSFHKLLDS